MRDKIAEKVNILGMFAGLAPALVGLFLVFTLG